jgi:transcriptional regulator with XRE-family HTH domain
MMSTNYETFGEFLIAKREENDITLREMARMLDVSPTFMSDVEKNRSTPKAERLEKLAEALHLDSDEKALMYDLVGKQRDSVAPDLPEYIKGRDYVSVALRTARDLDVGEKEWLEFVAELKKRKG